MRGRDTSNGLHVRQEQSLEAMGVSLFEELSRLEGDLAAMKLKKEVAAEELQRLSDAERQLRQKHDELQQLKRTLTAQLDAAQARNLTLEQALQQAHAERDESARQAKNFGAKCGTLARQVQALTTNEARLERLVADAREHADQLAAERDAHKETADRIRRESGYSISVLQNDVESRKQEMEVLQMRIAALNKDLAQARAAMDQASSELSQMQRAWDSDREQADKALQHMRGKLAKAINAGQAIRGAIVGGAERKSSHGDGLDTLLSQVPEATETAVQLISLSKDLQATVEQVIEREREREGGRDVYEVT